MSTAKIVAAVTGALAVLLAVAGGGFYLGSNYRLVPVGESAPAVQPALPTPQSLGLPAPPPVAPAAASAATTPAAAGPFVYKFKPGEVNGYALKASVTGNGAERDLGLGDIGLDFNAQFDLATEKVDQHGVADLNLKFNNVDMKGNFMGDEVTLIHGPGGGSITTPGQQVNQAQLNASPQMQFFRTPIEMSIGRDGRVISATGMPGFEQVLAPENIVATVGFPEAQMQPGHQWESEFNLPIPGFDTVAPARAVNTFERYITLAGHECAVIKQTISSSSTGGKLASPGGLLGEAMNFSVPTFSIDGESYIYFDTEIGKVRQADMDLAVNLELGEEMEAVKQIVGVYADLLNSIDGQQPAKKQPQEKQQPLLDLGMRIQSSLSLQDAFVAPAP